MRKKAILDFLPQRIHPLITGTYYTIFPKKDRVDELDFDGWGLKLDGKVMPWEKVGEELSKEYLTAESELRRMVQDNEFTLIHMDDDMYNELRCRHYIVYWTVAYASHHTTNSNSEGDNLVECGVADGVSAYFSMKSYEKRNQHFTMYLYDSWDSMREKELLESETSRVGKYNNLEKGVTQENLNDFRDSTVYREGYIPEVFDSGENPDSVSWLHIDLNSAIPTEEVLELYYERVEQGGVILFDDYGWKGYVETKNIVDEFFGEHNSGIHFPLPTGQSVYFKT
jgi:hypothetical protein